MDRLLYGLVALCFLIGLAALAGLINSLALISFI